jgi:hypothetical protein
MISVQTRRDRRERCCVFHTTKIILQFEIVKEEIHHLQVLFHESIKPRIAHENPRQI